MSKEQIISQLDQAIDAASKWADTGWTMKFGPYNDEVNSLQAAREKPETFVYRLEAIAYWEDIQEQGAETVAQGQKAKEALQNGNMMLARQAVHHAMFLEKKVNDKAPTWGKLFTAMSELN
ncbi:hypothetical protein [Magnetofaba australis]|uniref:Uncharacterized protein n=1 Tax=Magnetofaba australis IT-1 TaxID=1434232 RepID=A0A1Y2K5X0_9PROT|nr:hypothetical protein [Magnetofaba australis]OSM05102.1 hypothetical protein MAIT1_03247 [Magnetofaba australis IT-1]